MAPAGEQRASAGLFAPRRLGQEVKAAGELGGWRAVAGTGLSPLTQVQREVDGVGVLHPGQHGLALPPGGVGLVVVVGQEGCPVLQVGLPGVAQVTGLGDPGHPGLHTVLLGRSPARVGGHHGHVEGGVDELGHAALRSPALVRALVHGCPGAAGRSGRQHRQHRPEPPPGPQRRRGPLAALHPAARALGHAEGKGAGAFLSPGGVPGRPLRGLSLGAQGPDSRGGWWRRLRLERRASGRRWRGPHGSLATARLAASAPPLPTRDTARTRRRPPTSERGPESAPPGRKEQGVGSAGWGGVWRRGKPNPRLLSTAPAAPVAGPPPSSCLGLRVRPGSSRRRRRGRRHLALRPAARDRRGRGLGGARGWAGSEGRGGGKGRESEEWEGEGEAERERGRGEEGKGGAAGRCMPGRKGRPRRAGALRELDVRVGLLCVAGEPGWGKG